MRKILGLIAVALTLAGCLGDVPSYGPIQSGLENNSKSQENFVRAIVEPPIPGSDPVSIVRGFLSAAAAEENTFTTARLFLTDRAWKGWESTTERRVIDDRSQAWEYDNLRSPGLVLHKGTLTGRLLSGGEFEGSSGVRTDRFRLKLVNKEWRIDELPDGLTLTRSDLNRGYRQVALYFPDQQKRVLVPIVLYVPVRPGLATSLVRALLNGPAGWLAPALTTAFPKGSALSVDSVPIVDGLATVGLNANAATASYNDRTLMTAQLANTLKQIPEFRKLELSAGGAQIQVGQSTWDNYSLARTGTDPLLYFNTDRDLYYISTNAVDALPTFFSSSVPEATRGLSTPAVSADRSVLLSTDLQGNLLAADLAKAVGGLQVNGINPVLRTGSKLSQPQWDLQERYWTASKDKFGLWVGKGTGFPSKVEVPDFTGVEAFAIARDGVRLVVSTRIGGVSQIQLARLVAGSKGLRAEKPRIIWSSRDPILDMRADGPESVAALVGGKKIVSINLRELSVTTITSTPPAISFAAHPGRSLVIETEDHRLLIWRSRKWSQLTTGRNPSYSG